MRFLRDAAIALFTFVLGVGISPIHFYAEATAYGRMTDGNDAFSISSYKSNYFVKLLYGHEGYASPDKADDAFNQHLKNAVKLIEVTPKTSKQGLTIGRRAVAVFFEPSANHYYAVVFWTEGRFLYSICSTSLIHVVDFEKHQI
jgi:hypothetical protein